MNTPEPTAPELADGRYVTAGGLTVHVERRTGGLARVTYPNALVRLLTPAQWRSLAVGWARVTA